MRQAIQALRRRVELGEEEVDQLHERIDALENPTQPGVGVGFDLDAHLELEQPLDLKDLP